MTDTNPAKFTKLVTLLRELFQLDQPDLDFGIYRIMHAKAGEVTQFLERDLLPQVKDAFAGYQTADRSVLQAELAKAIEQAQALGADPDTLPKVKELRERIANEAVDIGALESETYDHLYSFFRRYYSEGDFLAKRVYKRGVYAIPYEGEEVTLHWANKDQYYIKTSEYLRDYAFRLKPEAGEGEDPMRVRFKLVDAAEGEHGNVKAAEGKDRVFVLSPEDFIAEVDGELELRFEYRPATLEDWPADQRDGKKRPPTQKELTGLAVQAVLGAGNSHARWLTELAKLHVKADGEQADYSRLEAHLRRYAARNTFDYFIHKDLGGFLRRELDFYIKNEVMHLDDVESETAPKVEQYLSKIKVVRRIAGKIIDFLAQLENFQKKLWLKKKFVVGSDWLVATSQVPDELLPEICANSAQLEEWKALHALHELPADITRPAYSEPLTPEYLRAHPSLLLDTRNFDAAYVSRLLESVGNLTGKADGVVMNGENFHALALMRSSYSQKVKSIYIDPPYNTGSDGFAYKDAYQHASWLSMIADRLAIARALMSASAGGACHLNDIEDWRMRALIESQFGSEAYVTTVITKASTASSFRTINLGPVDITDRVILFAKERVRFAYTPQFVEKPVDLQHFGRFITNPEALPEEWVYKPIRLQVLQDLGFNCGSSAEGMRLAADRWGDAARAVVEVASEKFALDHADSVFELKTLQKPAPWLREWIRRSEQDREKVFKIERDDTDPIFLLGGRQFYFLSKGVKQINGKASVTEPASTLWVDIDTNNLRHEGDVAFPAGKKPLRLVERFLRMSDSADGDFYLDFFAGSGTTGHAVINLNREDCRGRKFILAEQGAYFDSVLIPRMKKITYSPDWKDGKPKRLATEQEAERGPRMIKVLRLESYEDTLNNLALSRSAQQQAAFDFPAAKVPDGLREQYLLRYQLDVESRGSASLLNIAAFTDPTAYKLLVKTPGSDESREVNVDLLETFNWLLGLTVQHIAAPRSFAAEFERDGEGRLQIKGRLKQEAAGPWWFRTVTGTTPEGRKTLVIWRKLTGNAEQDNLVLETWFRDKQAFSVRDTEFDLIYVNGDNTLENIRLADESWKVRLTEEDFQRLMFEGTET